MTQLELANKMGISFQAVSNWERGNSMPDISKLPDIATLFDSTVDELLGEKSKLIESAINGEIKEYVENNRISDDELFDAAPILTPGQVDLIVEGRGSDSIKDIERLLPFLSEDMIDKLCEKAAREGNIDDLCIIAPFASEDLICEIAEMLYQKSGIGALTPIMPFIYEHKLGEIAERI